MISTVTKTGVNQIDSLLSGVKWGTNTVSYSFPTSGNQYLVRNWYSSNFETFFGFKALNTMQQEAARSALASWASVCNLKFTETTYGTGVIRFGTSGAPDTSWAYPPSISGMGGDVWFGNDTVNAPDSPIVGSYDYATYIHEIGHALGLKHPHEGGTVADSGNDCMEYSIMSYRSYAGADTWYQNASDSFATTPMINDIAAIQYMYGANYTYNAGNTVYKFDPTQGVIFKTIWDGGGNDTYDLSAYTTDLEVNLSPGGWSTFDINQLAYLGNYHLAQGNVANALLYKGDIRSLIENATGGSGNDTLIGNQANNVLNGGSGADDMVGGKGDDTYVVDNVGDVIVEKVGEGTDKVQSSVTYTLDANVDQLILTGVSNIDGTGNELNNIITGNDGDNILDGGAGVDAISGGKGNDTYVIDNTLDVIVEKVNEGTDTVQSSMNYTLGATFENLTLVGMGNNNGTGNGSNNVLIGNSGNNVLNGLLGADSMTGGAGNDIYMVDNALDVILELVDEGIDTVQSSVTYNTLDANVENLTLTGIGNINGTGNELNNIITGNSGKNSLIGGVGDDVLSGGLGADKMVGGVGNDTYVVDNTFDIVEELTDEGLDTVQSSITYTLGAYVENLTLTGAGIINGTGNALDNVIIGNRGKNTLSGKAGNDTYVMDNSIDSIIELANEGTDTVQSSVTYTLGANIENLTLTGTGSANGTGNTLDNIIFGNSGNNILNGGAGNDTLYGGAGNDTYILDNGSDSVVENENEGIDTVSSSDTYTLGTNLENLILTGTNNINGNGNELNNVISGNSGKNVLAGGVGDDTYVVDALDEVIENDNEGVDTVQSSITFNLEVRGTNVEKLILTGIANIDGFGNDLDNVIIGNSSKNILTGGIGNDTLDGSLGVDKMTGGTGNDIYIVENIGDIVIEDVSAGTDTVQSSIAFDLGLKGANIENLILTGASSINATGNELDNEIVGNSGANTLNGMSGADKMSGGLGNDIYVVDNELDLVVENASAGTDTVQSSVSYILSENVENLTLTGVDIIDGIGNDLSNIIIGNSKNNFLDGGLGADKMSGGLGNDTYRVDHLGDIVVENASAGTDLVEATISYTLGANVENLVLLGTNDINGIGNAVANDMSGNSGDNILNGGLGADKMTGGIGNDTYVVDNLGDFIIENTDAGIDTVQSSITFDLGSKGINIENLTLTGVSSINAIGNEFDNEMIGNNGNNILDGLAGADKMDGGLGNDTYMVDNLGDVVNEKANQGIDTVLSSVNFTLGDNIENLTLTSSGDINGTGNVLSNVITGNEGDNILDGGSGADKMTGGLGDDTYMVDTALDVVVENASQGNDTVQSSISYVLSTNLENLILLGANNIKGTGNVFANNVTGNSGDNILDGGLGVDIMAGGIGNDTYIVEDPGDVVIENVDAGIDTIQSGFTFDLSSAKGTNIENLTLTGIAHIDGTGNDFDNIIIGNNGNNILTGGIGNDTLNGGLGGDNMAGGVGDDIYVVDNILDVITESADQGTDTVQSSINFNLGDRGANIENLTLIGTGSINGIGNEFDNIMIGNSGKNSLISGAGNDTLNGGLGADTMVGGMGDDIYVADSILDIVKEDAAEGIDTVQSSVAYTLNANVEKLMLTGISNINGVGNEMDNEIIGNSGNNTLNGMSGIDRMSGGLGNDIYVVDNELDVIIENAGLNTGIDIVQSSVSYILSDNVENLILTGLNNIDGTGNELNNIITGNSKNNFLDGGLGADQMSGGLGNDTYIVDDVLDVVIESASQGMDIVQTSISYTLTANVEDLVLVGTDNITGTGNVLNNEIMGNSGDNILNGGLGADKMSGGIGNDTYVVDNLKDVIIEDADAGTDVVQSNITYTLGANIENLTLTGTVSINGTGNDLNNILTGNNGKNILNGGIGNDVLDGGLGADTMIGGIGDDIYIVDNILDTVAESADQGMDTVQSNIAYTLGSNIENLTLIGIGNINGIGNEYDNVIIGNSGNNILNGLLGLDTMSGGLGNDIYIVDNELDIVVEAVGQGTDVVQSSVTYTLSDNVENLTLVDESNINGTGNDLNNIMTGNSGKNVLTAGIGNDRLDGGLGGDTMIGDLGDDIYIVDDILDVVLENAGQGIDTVQSSITYSLGSDVEKLSLTGAGSINGTGNDLDNYLVGNSGDNILDGGLGADTMEGGEGNDIYVVDDLLDVVVETSIWDRSDTVNSSVTYTLSSNVEKLTLTGINNINGVGNALDNYLVGNSGDNILNGMSGWDTMLGGLGNDTYIVDHSFDKITENIGEGIDTVESTTSYTLGSNLENLTLTGTSNLYGTGNELDNIIKGNNGNNTLNGYGGNDILYGGLGIDSLNGGSGNDIYMFGADCGNDDVFNYSSNLLEVDILQFQDLALSDVTFSKNNIDDLICTINSTGATISITNWFYSDNYKLDQLKFSDGILTATEVNQKIV